MSEIFDCLPGLEVPVDSIAKRVSQLWADTAATGRAAPASEDFKATQVNFVVHFGFKTTVEDARTQFQTLLRFSQRYPSRVVVLCPLKHETGRMEMRAKIYGECFLGKSKHDTRCVEFVMLSYPVAARVHLENQVSICLSTDLPLYYWAHRFAESRRLADYTYLLTRAKRVLIDSAIAPPDSLIHPWPNPKSLRDLVYSRLLPVRQTVGQFLARYAPAALADGLKRVTVGHAEALGAEACVTTAWLQRRLDECGAAPDAIVFGSEPLAGCSLAIRFEYAEPKKFFSWKADLARRHAEFEADFGTGLAKLSAPAGLLEPEAALSEAMFF